MKIKKVTKENLEFLTNQLQHKEPIELKKKVNTYLFYDEKITAIVEQKKQGKQQKIEIKKYDPTFSTATIFPLIKKTPLIELPKEENLESIMLAMNYQKIKEKNDFCTYKRKKESLTDKLKLLKELKNFNIKQQFKEYFKLWGDEPEFKFYEILNLVSAASMGSLMGAVMPSFWDYGGTLQLAGTLAAIQKIVTPVTNIVSSGSMGTLVDKATKTTDIKDLKNLQKKIGLMNAFIAADTFLMQKDIIQMTPSPELTLLILFGIQTVTFTVGKMSLEGKSFYAIRDYLIRKNPEQTEEEYKKKFYQIIGTGQSLVSMCYASAFTSSWLACKSNPALIPAITTVSATTLVASKLLWAYQRKLKNPVTIKAKEYLEKGNSYVFDTGWTLETEQKEDLEKKWKGYQLPLKKGLTIKSKEDIKIKEKSYLELLTEKSSIKIKIKEGYKLDKINEREYNIKTL